MADEFFHTYDGVKYCNIFPATVLDQLKTFKFRPDDILIANYIKSGGVTMCELVWLIMNNCDVSKAAEEQVRSRVRMIELQVSNQRLDKIDSSVATETPRIMSTCISHDFFADQLRKTRNKVIVMLRNPKDVLVSSYQFYRMNKFFGTYEGSWDDFFEKFKRKEMATGDWFDHIASWWRGNRDRVNFLFVKFEDFLNDPRAVIREVATFCGKDLCDADVEKLANHTSFSEMSVNPAVNMTAYPAYQQHISPFFRKGVVGDWKNYFSREQSEYVDRLYKTSCLNMGLSFRYE